MKQLSLVVAAVLVSGSVQAANDFNNLQLLSQVQFQQLSENLAAASSYKAVSPAEPMGTLGFDVGLELSVTEINEAVFDVAAAGGWDLSQLPVPKLHAHKGLPFGIDVGAFYTSIPETSITLWGGELRYAFLTGGIASPAIAIRATYSQLGGIDELELDNRGIEIAISKGFLMFTPYAGAGKIYSTAKAVNVATLDDEELEQDKLFAGVNINFGTNLAFEVDKTGEYSTFSAKIGFRF